MSFACRFVSLVCRFVSLVCRVVSLVCRFVQLLDKDISYMDRCSKFLITSTDREQKRALKTYRNGTRILGIGVKGIIRGIDTDCTF